MVPKIIKDYLAKIKLGYGNNPSDIWANMQLTSYRRKFTD